MVVWHQCGVSYLLKLIFVLGRRWHGGIGVLQPLFGLSVEGQTRGWRRERVLHHRGRDVDGVGGDWHTFAPSQLHFKVHYHFSWKSKIISMLNTAGGLKSNLVCKDDKESVSLQHVSTQANSLLVSFEKQFFISDHQSNTTEQI